MNFGVVIYLVYGCERPNTCGVNAVIVTVALADAHRDDRAVRHPRKRMRILRMALTVWEVLSICVARIAGGSYFAWAMQAPATTTQMRLIDWRSLNAHLLWAYRGPVVAPAGMFRNDHLVAWRLLEGRVEVKGAKSTCHAQAGEWLFPPSRHDQRRFSTDAQLISVHFQARWADGRMLFEESEPAACSSDACPELDAAALAVVEALEAAFPKPPCRHPEASSAIPEPTKNLAQEHTDFFTYLKIEDTLPRWLTAYTQARQHLGASLVLQGTSESRVLRGLDMLNDWPVDKPLLATHLADRLGLSLSQLNRLFVAETGKTPLRHFDDRRLEVARNLLRTSTLQVKEIAYAVGFKQPAHFSNWFFKKSEAFPLSCRRTILPPSRSV